MKESHVARIGRALGNENRVTLLKALENREKPVNIADKLGMSRAGLQKHLEVLINEGIVVKQGSGRNTKYIPTPATLKIMQQLEDITRILDQQLQVSAIISAMDSLEKIGKTDDDFYRELERQKQLLEDTINTWKSTP